jgi:hypothetical protein
LLPGGNGTVGCAQDRLEVIPGAEVGDHHPRFEAPEGRGREWVDNDHLVPRRDSDKIVRHRSASKMNQTGRRVHSPCSCAARLLFCRIPPSTLPAPGGESTNNCDPPRRQTQALDLRHRRVVAGKRTFFGRPCYSAQLVNGNPLSSSPSAPRSRSAASPPLTSSCKHDASPSPRRRRGLVARAPRRSPSPLARPAPPLDNSRIHPGRLALAFLGLRFERPP